MESNVEVPPKANETVKTTATTANLRKLKIEVTTLQFSYIYPTGLMEFIYTPLLLAFY